jgi:hypothetical protein
MSNRPLYETQLDLDKESIVQSVLEKQWRCKLKKLPIAYHVDWIALRNNQPLAFVEIKHREKLEFNKYPTYMISLNKWMKAKELAKEVNVPFILVVKFMDGIYYGKYTTDMIIENKYGFNGRYDRGDAQDVEPMVYIPLSIFKKL